jgi:hypothetical protein
MSIVIGNVIGTLDVSGSPISNTQNITLTEAVPHSTETIAHAILVLVAIETAGLIGHLDSPGTWLVPGMDIYDAKSGANPYPSRVNETIPNGSGYWPFATGTFALNGAGGTIGVGSPASTTLDPHYQIIGSKYVSIGDSAAYWIFQSLAAGDQITLDFTNVAADVPAGGITWAGAKLIKIYGLRGGPSVPQPPIPSATTHFTGPSTFDSYSVTYNGASVTANWHTWLFAHGTGFSSGSPTYTNSPIEWQDGSFATIFTEAWSINRTVDLTGGGRVAHFGWGYHDYETTPSPTNTTLTPNNVTSSKNHSYLTIGSGGSWPYTAPRPVGEASALNAEFRAYQ